MRLSPTQLAVLRALARGETLKAHRFLDGRKQLRLHPLDGGPPRPVRAATVAALRRHGLVDSNMKFPAATYLLTELGRHTAEELWRQPVRALGARGD